MTWRAMSAGPYAADDDRGIGDALFELPGMLAVCGTALRTLLATS